MAIKDLTQKVYDGGKTEKVVLDFCRRRIDTWQNSKTHDRLKSRFQRLNDAIDMKHSPTNKSTSRGVNSWKANVVMPLVREQFVAQRAFLSANYINDPIITVYPENDTKRESSEKMQMVLNSVLRKSYFREKFLSQTINQVSHVGSSVGYITFENSIQEIMKTVGKNINGIYMGNAREPIQKRVYSMKSHKINIMNYFQNPEIPDWEMSDYKGYFDRIRMSEFISEYQDNDNYIKRNVESVIKEGKKEGSKDKDYYTSDTKEWGWRSMDLTHYWGVIDIEGNEDDTSLYYLVICNDKILGMFKNEELYDENICPLTVFGVDPRENVFYSDNPIETQIPLENVMQTIFSMSIENGLRSLRNFVLYNKATFGADPQDINTMAKNGGWIPFDMKPGMTWKDAVMQLQFPDASMNNYDWIMREIKESSQRGATKVDFSRQPQQGGLQNKTATAAQMMNEMGDIQQAYFIRQFNYGLLQHAYKMTVLLQQKLGDRFRVRPDVMGAYNDSIEIMKNEIFGDYQFYVETCLTKNTQIQAMNFMNALTAIQNFRGQPSPEWMNVNIGEIVRGWLRSILPNMNIDNIMPKQAPTMPGMPPQGMMPGMPQGIPQMQGAPNVI